MKKSKKSSAPELIPSTPLSPSAGPGPASQPAPSLSSHIDHELRKKNRHLSAERVMDWLRRWLPDHCDKAYIAHKWIWIQFREKPSEEVRAILSQLGFHWNERHECWQHPCGVFNTLTIGGPDGQPDSYVKGADQP